MKNKFTKIVITAVLIAGMAGCNKPVESEDSSSAEQYTRSTIESTQSEPDSDPQLEGELTNIKLIDGKTIYTSELNMNPTADEIEQLSDNMYYAEPVKPDAVINSFAILKPSTGTSFNTVENPERFDEAGVYTGEEVKNTSEWQRVKIGEEICGLKLKSAGIGFTKKSDTEYVPTGRLFCEFEGEITVTGYLYVRSPAELYGDPGGDMSLSFPTSELPLSMGVGYADGDADAEKYGSDNYRFTEMSFGECFIFNHDIRGYSEVGEMFFDETIDETSVDMGGIMRGDVIKVRATMNALKFSSMAGGYPSFSAHLEKIEPLGEVIANG